MAVYKCREPSVALVLDNFEHLIDGGGETVPTLLERVETLTILVTSRQLLGLAGERKFPVGPFPTPLPVDSPPRLMACESVRLFVDRAQVVRPDFQVTDRNLPAVVALCTRLEGLPLAIELAAARVGVLTPQQILARLEQRLELQTARRVADPRHSSLRATLDWSYRLLSPELQRLFERLSVLNSVGKSVRRRCSGRLAVRRRNGTALPVGLHRGSG